MSIPLALDVSGLCVRFGDTHAVDGVDLAIPRGQTVALLGPEEADAVAALAVVDARAGRPLHAVSG